MILPNSSTSERFGSSEQTLEILRLLFIPVAIFAALLYLPAMLGAIMISDSGTDTAIRGSLWSMIGLTVYLVSTLLVAAKWSNWPRGSAILLSILTVVNVVPLVLFPGVTVRVPLVFLSIFRVRFGDTLAAIVGGVLYGVFFVLVQAVSAWKLFLRAIEVDLEISNQVNEGWDLSSLSHKDTPR